MERPTLEDVAPGGRRLQGARLVGDARFAAGQRRTRQRVLESANLLGYRPNLMARNLAARRTMTIGVLLNDLHNPWFAEVLDGVHDVAEANGYQLILASGRRLKRLESRRWTPSWHRGSTESSWPVPGFQRRGSFRSPQRCRWCRPAGWYADHLSAA